MKKTLFQKLACPFDKHDLALQIFKEEDENIVEGIFTCTHCHRYYPIVSGIPIMSPDEYREPALEQPLLARWGLQIGNDAGAFKLLPAAEN
jgi:uncharacterized protein YbaR (Trm112 family)